MTLTAIPFTFKNLKKTHTTKPTNHCFSSPRLCFLKEHAHLVFFPLKIRKQGILVTVFLFSSMNCLSLFAEVLGRNSCLKIRQFVKEEISYAAWLSHWDSEHSLLSRGLSGNPVARDNSKKRGGNESVACQVSFGSAGRLNQLSSEPDQSCRNECCGRALSAWTCPCHAYGGKHKCLSRPT